MPLAYPLLIINHASMVFVNNKSVNITGDNQNENIEDGHVGGMTSTERTGDYISYPISFRLLHSASFLRQWHMHL